MNKYTSIEQILCKKIANAVAPYANSAPRYFHNDEKYCNVPYTDIETVAKEIARMFEPKVYPDIEVITKVVDDLAKKLNLREETVSGVDEIGMVQNAIMKLLQSQADQYEREKGEMVRVLVNWINTRDHYDGTGSYIIKTELLEEMETFAQKYSVDLSE